VEHPAELEIANRALELGHVAGDARERRVVGLCARQLEQLSAVPEPLVEAGERSDDLVELLSFLAELLRPPGVAPDARVLELFRYDSQALRLGVEVKDTSADRPRAAAGRKARRKAG